MRKFLTICLIVAGVSLLFTTCSQFNDNNEENIRGLITGTYGDYFSVFGVFNDGGAVDDGMVISETAYLPHWGRKIDGINTRSITINIEGNTAEVYVWTDWMGEFLVDTTQNGIPDPGSKPLHDVGERYAEFEKNQDGNWELTRISPAEIHLYDSDEQTVSISSIHVWDTDEDVDLTITDPTELMNIEDVPVFEAGELVYVETAVENTSSYDWEPPHFVYLHFPGGRDLFYNTGDDIHFQGSWVPYNPGVHHAAIDIINSNCLQNETEDDYDSGAWALPYIVE